MKKVLLFLTLLAFVSLKAQIVNIPDANFKAILLAANTTNVIAKDATGNYMVIDANGDNEIQNSEAAAVYELTILNSNISNLTGIEDFVNLTNLNCGLNGLTTLDISQNTNLIILDCHDNQLTTLDVSQNTELAVLRSGNNQLTTLDVSQNTSLTSLGCVVNELMTLDISQNTSLLTLYCYGNQLTTLDVSQNTDLINLDCSNNQLTTLDVSQNTNLTQLTCSSNPNLGYINLKNGNNDNFNASIYYSGFSNLPNLHNVCVDALNTDLTDFITAQTGHAVTYSTDCSALSVLSNDAQLLLKFNL